MISDSIVLLKGDAQHGIIVHKCNKTVLDHDWRSSKVVNAIDSNFTISILFGGAGSNPAGVGFLLTIFGIFLTIVRGDNVVSASGIPGESSRCDFFVLRSAKPAKCSALGHRCPWECVSPSSHHQSMFNRQALASDIALRAWEHSLS